MRFPSGYSACFFLGAVRVFSRCSACIFWVQCVFLLCIVRAFSGCSACHCWVQCVFFLL